MLISYSFMNQNNSGFFGSIPPVTKNLLIINLLCYLAQYVVASKTGTDYLAFWGGLHYVGGDTFYPHHLITYMFLHCYFQHMFFNMFAVFMFGRALESMWGQKRFLFYYMATGIGAGLIQLLVWYFMYDMPGAPDYILSVISVIGASGAVFGILVAFGMTFPNSELFIIPFPFPIKAKYFVIGYGLLELYLGFANNPADPVAHFAHLGGLIFGVIIILYWKKKDRR